MKRVVTFVYSITVLMGVFCSESGFSRRDKSEISSLEIKPSQAIIHNRLYQITEPLLQGTQWFIGFARTLPSNTFVATEKRRMKIVFVTNETRCWNAVIIAVVTSWLISACRERNVFWKLFVIRYWRNINTMAGYSKMCFIRAIWVVFSCLTYWIEYYRWLNIPKIRQSTVIS